MFAAATVHEHRLYHITSTWTHALMSLCSVGVCSIHAPIFLVQYLIADIGSCTYIDIDDMYDIYQAKLICYSQWRRQLYVTGGPRGGWGQSRGSNPHLHNLCDFME